MTQAGDQLYIRVSPQYITVPLCISQCVCVCVYVFVILGISPLFDAGAVAAAEL